MQLAKPGIDIGLYTNQIDAQLKFWGETAGLAFDHMLKLGNGVQQHRFHAHGSIVKVNHAREAIADTPPSGFARLLIVREDVSAETTLQDADGSLVSLVPQGFRGMTRLGIEMAVNDRAKTAAFLTGALDMVACGEDAYRSGDTIIFLKTTETPIEPPRMFGTGYRYMTIQVKDCDTEYNRIIAAGGAEGRAPSTLGDVARISFVRDPDVNWIEVSQRASVTGTPV